MALHLHDHLLLNVETAILHKEHCLQSIIDRTNANPDVVRKVFNEYWNAEREEHGSLIKIAETHGLYMFGMMYIHRTNVCASNTAHEVSKY